MPPKIRSCALDLLARREHSQSELKNKLLAKGFDSSDIEKVLQDLAARGLQSDSRFVEAYIAMRSRRGFGPERIKAELKEKGGALELIDQFLDKSDSIWFELVKDVHNKKFGVKIPENLADQAKQKRYLYYKGFTADQIKNCFKND
jgi:regulatory protein